MEYGNAIGGLVGTAMVLNVTKHLTTKKPLKKKKRKKKK